MQKFTQHISYELSHPWHLYQRFDRKLVRKYAQRLALTTYTVVAFVVMFQLLYPHNRALPFARLENGVWVGFQSTDKITANLQTLNQQKLTVIAKDTEIKVTPIELGIEMDAKATAQATKSYSWKERFIPFSIFSKSKTSYPLVKNYDQPKLTHFAQSLTATPGKEPKDAAVTLEGTKITVVPGEDGYSFNQAELEKQLRETDVTLYDHVALSPHVLRPRISTDTAAKVASTVQERISHPITISVEEKNVQFDSSQIASWFTVRSVPEKGVIDATFDQAKIKTSLKPFSETVYLAPTSTAMTSVDGQEAQQRAGSPGRMLAVDQLVQQLAQAQSSTTANFTGQVAAVPSVKIYSGRSYTRSSAGLQALINYWVQNHKGQYGIDLRAIDGSINASSNPNKRFTSASIYKLYVASLVYSRITAGSLSGSSATNTGLNVDDCLYKMIHISDNACAVALGNIVGWSANDATLHAQGFENTTLTSGAHLTTANDAADWLTKLLNGSLVTDEQKSKLLQVMQQQIYRSGIPAGSKGMVVADKVGFLDGYYHDAAIVYHPKGTYVLTIFSDGSDVAAIADLSSQISQVMNQ